MQYEPRPVDTSAVVVPPELLALTERQAENTHEVWARRKLADGWRYGPQTDPAAKTHCDLIPYADLSEDKKAYDRDTALETIKLILALGYKVMPG
jgi:hypothetical protein